MTLMLDPAPAAPAPSTGPDPDRPRTLKARGDAAERPFRWMTRSAASAVLIIMSLVGIFLLVQGGQALGAAGFDFLTTEAWEPNSGEFGIAAVLTGTVLIAITAILVAVPFATATALYISEYAPRWIK